MIALQGTGGGGEALMLMAERTCLPTAARLEAVGFLQGPLCAAALNPVAKCEFHRASFPHGLGWDQSMGLGWGPGCRAQRYTAMRVPWCGSGAAGSVQAWALLRAVPYILQPHPHTSRRRNPPSRLLIQPHLLLRG